jgi:hypothetical protein
VLRILLKLLMFLTPPRVALLLHLVEEFVLMVFELRAQELQPVLPLKMFLLSSIFKILLKKSLYTTVHNKVQGLGVFSSIPDF